VAIAAPAVDLLTHTAIVQGYFKKQGLTVSTEENALTNVPSLVVSGKADVGSYGGPTPILVSSQGKPASAIYAMTGGGQGGSILAAPKYKTIADLQAAKKCKLATFPAGGVGYGWSIHYIKTLKLDCTILQLKDLGAQIAAVATGHADAIIGGVGNYTGAITEGKLRIILDTREPEQRAKYVGQAFPEVSMFALDSTLNSKRSAFEKYLKGINEAAAFIDQSSDDAVLTLFKGDPVYGAVKASDVAAFRIYHRTVSNGYISEPVWKTAVTSYAQWGIPQFKADAPNASYSQGVAMAPYEAVLGKPSS
jgi:ABC-type nitrate/sulfonate/bicarbonate transport system substrate-binding protein